MQCWGGGSLFVLFPVTVMQFLCTNLIVWNMIMVCCHFSLFNEESWVFLICRPYCPRWCLCGCWCNHTNISIFQIKLCLWILVCNVSLPAWIICAGISSLPGDLYLFHFATIISASIELGSGTNGSAVWVSLCLKSLTLCTFYNWEKQFFHLFKMVWESASRSPFSSFTKFLLGG
jgi:hypothetical protein